MRRLFVVPLAIAGLVIMLAVPVGAANALPFEANATVVSISPVHPILDPCGDPAEGFMGQVVVYDGTGTHLGRFELVETICLELGALGPEQPLLPFEVFGTYRAANKDQLHLYVEGTINVATGEVVDGGFHFTGGTGRFESATGSGHATLIRAADGTLIAQTASGVISYTASDRSR